MNVLVIPSWYPSDADPMAGLFVRDQAEAVAAARPDWNIAVGRWGHHDGALSLRDPRASLRALAWRMRATGRPPVRVGPLWDVCTPRLSWTLHVAGGGVRGMLRASRRNFAAVAQRLGRIDLLHAHVGFPAGWIAARLSAENAVPYVLTEHMSPFPFPALRDRGGRIDTRLREAFERAAATVAVSAPLAASIRAEGLPCSDVIGNVVDERRFAADAAPAAPPFVLLALGALRPQKGIDVLLRAFRRWNPPPGSVELRIGGDGEQRAELQALAAALGIADRVRWLGRLHPDQVPAALASSHTFVLPSRHETFGVVVAEALMSGRPVVATRCGGPETLVGPAQGRLVDVGDEDALAEALAWMLANAKRFDPQALRADALRRFSRAAVGGQLAALFEAVVGRR